MQRLQQKGPVALVNTAILCTIKLTAVYALGTLELSCDKVINKRIIVGVGYHAMEFYLHHKLGHPLRY